MRLNPPEHPFGQDLFGWRSSPSGLGFIWCFIYYLEIDEFRLVDGRDFEVGKLEFDGVGSVLTPGAGDEDGQLIWIDGLRG